MAAARIAVHLAVGSAGVVPRDELLSFSATSALSSVALLTSKCLMMSFIHRFSIVPGKSLSIGGSGHQSGLSRLQTG